MSDQNKFIRPIKDHIIVCDMYFGDMKTSSGIIIMSDDGKSHGIKPRWAKVYAIGPDVTDVEENDWVLIEHGRWTRGFDFDQDDGSKITLRKIDNDSILLISDENPEDVHIASERLLDLHTD